MPEGVTVVQEEKTRREPCRGNGSTLSYAAVLLCYPAAPRPFLSFTHTKLVPPQDLCSRYCL